MPAHARFHAATLQLLGVEFTADTIRQKVLDQRECEIGVAIPPSIREWYSLSNAEDVLTQHCLPDSYVCPIHDLGKPVCDSSYGECDFVSRGMLWLTDENQSAFGRACKLAGDDPEILINPSGELLDWRPCMDSFSMLVYCQVWANPAGWFHVYGLAQESVSGKRLRQLTADFRQLPKSQYDGGDWVFRFELPRGRLIVYSFDKHEQSSWEVIAHTDDDLRVCQELLANFNVKWD
jgi:hypothetical protein